MTFSPVGGGGLPPFVLYLFYETHVKVCDLPCRMVVASGLFRFEELVTGEQKRFL
jgi:hypothetical protein